MSDTTELERLDHVIKNFAPEVADIYYIREDESEEQQIKTGRLHENRILGIILKYFLEGKPKVTTGEVEQEYKNYFKEIARSTISTYLNMLKKESTLYKERDGRIVYYIFYKNPPLNIHPFWFTRIFCIVPAYFVRAYYFSDLFLDAEQTILDKIEAEKVEMVLENYKFLIGLIILQTLKNRSSKCVLCQFSKEETYNSMEEGLEEAIKDRSDVLPEALLKILADYGELSIFGGIDLEKENVKQQLVDNILILEEEYRKDLEFQIMVSKRRIERRLSQLEGKKLDQDTEPLE
ncbi:MAG: hypothetical protein EU533_06115 [Promethearchaeota archaeon]|nr:MAG: hypothetical protein EU533_06115 [Candidatus Lokiarchaeota archaeon]